MAVAEEDTTAGKVQENNTIEWTVRNEVELLLALMGHKPVGVSKYFRMACILEKFSMAVNREDISSKVIWDRLDTMYDMQALEETELLPFPNETEDFSLPKAQYGELIEQKKNGTMPPPRVPSPPPDIIKKEEKDMRKDAIRDSNIKKETKDVTKKGDDKKASIKEIGKCVKEDVKKDKKLSKDVNEEKKKETSKGKEATNKELRATKRGVAAKDEEDSPVVLTGSAKKSRDPTDTDDTSTPKRSGAGGAGTPQPTNSKAKRPTRLSHGKVTDDNGSNKSVSPVTVSSPPSKRRRNV